MAVVASSIFVIRSEHVVIEAAMVFELEFRDMRREIFAVHFV